MSARHVFVVVAIISAATLAAYGDGFRGPFVFDDIPAIVENPTIRQLWPLSTVLSPPRSTTVAGRPLVNLSLAANYAIGRSSVWGYHVLNLAIHLLAALILFDLIRRTLAVYAPADDRWAPIAIACAAALWWAVHPLQTAAVTYLVQRAESLCGLFYLATLYFLLRGARAARPEGWYAASALACWMGMATKEVMATAPLVALAYDRTFLAGSFRQAWRERRRLYAMLAASWLLMAYLVLGTGGRSGSAGFDHNITPVRYAATQAGAILHYLRLSIWPEPLVFDYGRHTVSGLSDAWPQVSVVIALLLAAAMAWRRWPALGFLGVAFFVVLAPSSSFVPVVTQTVAEHRMYLPLAAVCAILASAGYALSQRVVTPRGPKTKVGERLPRAYLVCASAIAALLGWQTWNRNDDYRSEASIWADTVAKVPDNARAWVNLARTDYNTGDVGGALEKLDRAAELDPDDVDVFINRGFALQGAGRLAAAIRDFDRAIELQPTAAGHYYRRAVARVLAGQSEEAIADYQKALDLRPDYAQAWYDLANLYRDADHLDAAVQCYGRAIAAAPGFVNAWKNRAAALGQLRRYAEAIDDCNQALALSPRSRDIYQNRAIFHYRSGQPDAARNDLQIFARLGGQPDAELARQLGLTSPNRP
ncbi:MAG TPA: tetratricopeptide repeat protein [Pirellulales bacterium]|nr:tetratricopeptide repeat protein [Pirellulales bacterium]